MGSFDDFRLTSQLAESVEGKSNTMCEIRKPRAEVTVDDGEYTCQLLKCAAPKDEPEDEGCNASPDQFDQYDVLRAKQNNTVHVKILATVTKIQGVTDNGGLEKNELGVIRMITIFSIYFYLLH